MNSPSSIAGSPESPALSALSAAIVWTEATNWKFPLASFADDDSINHADLLPLLAVSDAARAKAMSDAAERRHFVLRRCFQAVFVKVIVDWSGPIDDLLLVHATDKPPRCLRAPQLSLSFSSSGPIAIACAAPQAALGIDIERFRHIDRASDVASRFFTTAEAANIAGLPEHEQGVAFLKFWSAKEAGLKATGKGIVSGLNNFTLFLPDGQGPPTLTGAPGGARTWHLHELDVLPQHIVTLVHSAVAIPHMA